MPIATEANNMLSKRSKIPPCPGKIVPESFTPKLRFNNDSLKSPKVAKITIISEKPNHWYRLNEVSK